MKRANRIASLLLALILVMGMAIPAFAASNNNSHIITVDDAQSGHVYEAYQVFYGDISGGVLVDIVWGNGIKNKDALQAELNAMDDYKECENAADVAEVVAGYGDNSEKLDAFASVVGKYLTAPATSGINSETGACEINVTGDGYYLVKDKAGSLADSEDAYTKYILKVVADTTVTPKADAPELGKVIVDGTTPTVSNGSIGDKVQYKLTSAVPAMDGYNDYFFIIHDTMSAGLTFNNDVVVTIGGKELNPDKLNEDGSVKQYEDFGVVLGEDGETFRIILRDFLDNYKKQEGAAIVVTYSATINENAVVAGNVNDAYLEFSNDPNVDYKGGDPTDEDDPHDPDEPNPDPDGDPSTNDTEPTGKTPNSEVVTYTTAIQLKKVNSDGETLTGAKFQIGGDSAKAVVINSEIYQKSESGTYYRLKDGTYTETAPITEGDGKNSDSYDSVKDTYVKVNAVTQSTELSTIVKDGYVKNNGTIQFYGLGAGTYTIKELAAPVGYNKLTSDITVTIDFAVGENNAVVWTVNATVEDKTFENIEAAGGCYAFDVVNNEGVTLPATGGIGTTIFYILGSVLVLGAIVLLVTRKRMAAEQ